MIHSLFKDKHHHEYNEITSTTYLMSNMDALKQLPHIPNSLALIDPPYGLGNRLSDGGGKLKNTPMSALYKDKEWDELPPPEFWKELFRVTEHQVIFGANYFLEYLPSTRGFICWDKDQYMPTLSACELVWTSFDKPAKIYRKSSMDLERFHPTQKPIGIYDFCINYINITPSLIIDTHLGSGSSRITAHKAKINFIGFELDPEYFHKANKRFDNHKAQLTLF